MATVTKYYTEIIRIILNPTVIERETGRKHEITEGYDMKPRNFFCHNISANSFSC